MSKANSALSVFDNVRYRAPDELYDASTWYEVDYRAYKAEAPFYDYVCENFLEAGDAYCELGAGTGRLLLGIAKKGIHVHAVEPASSMRDRMLQDAEHLNLTERISIEAKKATDFEGCENMGVISFPFNGVLHLSTHDELHAMLRHVREKLKGGVFALDMTMPSYEAMALGRVAWGRVDERVHPDNGKRIVTCDRTDYDPLRRVLRTEYRFIYADQPKDEGVELFLEQRMWTYPEILQALSEEGYFLEATFGDVDFKPFRQGSPRLMLVASCD